MLNEFFYFVIIHPAFLNCKFQERNVGVKNNIINNGFQITTVDNVVYLTGIAQANEARKIIETIHSIKDIKDVDASNLKITDAKISQINDMALSSKIKGALMKERFFKDKSFDFDKIRVKTKDGNVTLFGQPTLGNAIKAEKIAKRITGVKNVTLSFNKEIIKYMK